MKCERFSRSCSTPPKHLVGGIPIDSFRLAGRGSALAASSTSRLVRAGGCGTLVVTRRRATARWKPRICLLLASGTASLEAALWACRRSSPTRCRASTQLVISACIRLGLIDAYPIGLPNLILAGSSFPSCCSRQATAGGAGAGGAMDAVVGAGAAPADARRRWRRSAVPHRRDRPAAPRCHRARRRRSSCMPRHSRHGRHPDLRRCRDRSLEKGARVTRPRRVVVTGRRRW